MPPLAAAPSPTPAGATAAPREPPVAVPGHRDEQRAVADRVPARIDLPVAVPGIRDKQRAVRLRRVLVAMAGRHHGMVAWRHLRAAGFSSSAIGRLVAAGWLHPVHRGVYHVGHAVPTRLGAHAAATLAFGKRTAVSHRAAAQLHELLPDEGRAIEVTTASGNSGLHDGVVVHESRRLLATDVRRVTGIAVVSLEWSLVDLAGTRPADFTRAFNAIDRRGLVDPLRLAGQLRRGRRGSALVRDRLETYTGHPPTESELEDMFLAGVVDAFDLPSPTHQASPLPQRPQRVDFTWPGPRVAVEIDSRQWHAIQATWGEDHERDLALRLSGWTPLRYTHRQLSTNPERVAEDLRNALRPPEGGRSDDGTERAAT